MHRIETIADLEALYGTPSQPALRKVAAQLTPLYRAWIEGSRFCVLSTVGTNGVHGTPRGDDGPVVRANGPGQLLMPDWRGNNRLDGLRDIVEDGRVALLFMVPGSRTTVRVNGRAWLTDDVSLRESFARGAILPATVIIIEIVEIYTQCAKAVIRSGLWTRDDAASVPTVGEILAEMTDGEHGGPEYDATYDTYAIPRMW